MGRDKEGLEKAIEEIPKLRDEFWQNVNVAGEKDNLNKNLEFAGRVADYMELVKHYSSVGSALFNDSLVGSRSIHTYGLNI